MNENILLIRDICEKFDIENVNHIFNIDPFHAPRMVRSDKYAKRKCVVNYFNSRNALKILALQKKYGIKSVLNLIFVIPYPQSWSEKKKKENYLQPVDVKPDIDNLVKAFMDSLCSNDSHIWKISAIKIYSSVGRIIVI